MHLRLLALLMISMATPVCAQTVATQSGAMSMVNITDPPPGIVAPGLAAAGIETCLGSSSGGLSLMGGGFTFGSTKVDEGCTIRLLSRQLITSAFTTSTAGAASNGSGYAQTQTSGYAGGNVSGYGAHLH
jgi:hypothetical protein